MLKLFYTDHMQEGRQLLSLIGIFLYFSTLKMLQKKWSRNTGILFSISNLKSLNQFQYLFIPGKNGKAIAILHFLEVLTERGLSFNGSF